MKANEIKALHEAVYSQYHLLLQYSNRAADATMNITKAQEVEQVYDTAAWDDNLYSEGCYSRAVAAAHELGGIEIANSNDDNRSKSFAPSITFEFDDSSSVYIMCGGVYVIEPNQPY